MVGKKNIDVKNSIIIGNMKNSDGTDKRPKRKYRILVQERLSENCDTEKMRSFMVYDFNGKSTIESVRKNFLKIGKNKKKNTGVSTVKVRFKTSKDKK
jgi:hypothetical protein